MSALTNTVTDVLFPHNPMKQTLAFPHLHFQDHTLQTPAFIEEELKLRGEVMSPRLHVAASGLYHSFGPCDLENPARAKAGSYTRLCRLGW